MTSAQRATKLIANHEPARPAGLDIAGRGESCQAIELEVAPGIGGVVNHQIDQLQSGDLAAQFRDCEQFSASTYNRFQGAAGPRTPCAGPPPMGSSIRPRHRSRARLGKDWEAILAPSVRPARMGALTTQQRTGAVPVAASIGHPLETALTGASLEEQRRTPIAQTLNGKHPPTRAGASAAAEAATASHTASQPT